MKLRLSAVVLFLGATSCTDLMVPPTAPVVSHAPTGVTLTGVPALKAMVRDGRFEPAIDGAKAMLTQQVSDPVTLAGAREVMAEATRGLANQARGDGRVGDAVNLARGLVDALPNQPESYALLAETLSAAGQRAEADTALNRALELGSASAAVHAARGAIMADRGDLGAATAALRKAVELDPKDSASSSALARVLALSGRLSEAVQAQQAAVGILPKDAGHRNRLALLQLLAGDADAAETTVKETKATCPIWKPEVPTGPTFSVKYSHIDITFSPAAAVKVTPRKRLTGSPRLEYPVVVAVNPNAAAGKAGVLVGDILKSLQGKDLRGLDNAAVVTAFYPWTPDGSLDIVVSRLEGKTEVEKSLNLKGATDSQRGAYLLTRESEPDALLARCLLARGSAVRALRAAEEGLAANPLSLSLRVAAALAHLGVGQPQKAIDTMVGTYTSTLERWLGDLNSLVFAVALAQVGQTDPALRSWERVKTAGGVVPCATFESLRSQLRSALGVQGLEAEVRSSSDRAAVVAALGTLRKLAWTPAEEAAVRDLALAWGRRQRPVPALPDEARNHLLRMQVFLREKDAAAAGAEIAAAIDLAPWDASLYYNAALVAAGAEDYRRAVAFMTTYVGANPAASDAAQARDQIVQWGALADRKDQGR